MFNRFVIPERKLFSKLLYYKSKNITPIIDYAVENNQHKYIFEQKYNQLFYHYPNYYHAIKLSGLNLCSDISKNLAYSSAYTNNKFLIDAEEVRIQDRINTIANKLILDDNHHIFKTYQMYRKDSIELLLSDIEYFTNKKKTLNIKLVRGAYLYQDKYSGALYDKKEDTDKAYNYAIDVLKSHQQDLGEVIFATHNKTSYDKVKYMDNEKCFHACLMGFDEQIKWRGEIRKMVYIPFGPSHKTFPYMIRRLYENPYILNN